MQKFSNLPLIAKNADDTLSKLIEAKSPLIQSWIKARAFDPTKDTEKIVKEWRSYYAQFFVINKYKSNAPEIDREVEKLFDDLNTRTLDKKTKDRFQNNFEAAKNASKQILES